MNSSYGKSNRSMGQQILFIMQYVRKYPMLLVFFPFLIAVDITFDMGIAKMQGLFIDVANTGSVTELFTTIKWTVFLLVIGISFLVLHRFAIRLLKGLVQRDLATDLFRKVHNQPYESMLSYHSGDIITRIREDTRSGADIVEAIIEFVTVVVIIAASFIYLISINVFLALFALIGAPLLLLVGRMFDRRIDRLSASIQILEAEVRGMTLEILQGLDVVRVYGLSEPLLKGITVKREQLVEVRRKLDMTSSISANLTEALFYIFHIGALLLISLAAVRGTLTPGTIVTFSLLFELVIWPVIGLNEQWNRLYEGGGAFRRIQEFLDRNERTSSQENRGVPTENGANQGDDSKEHLHALNRKTAIIDMNRVSYQPSTKSSPIINDIDFTMKQGEVVAVVGPSGAGKSTFAALCCGLLQPTAGVMKLSYSLVERDRPDTLYLAQQTYLFTGSISENIRLSDESASNEEIASAAFQACIHEDIEQLMFKFDTEIGEGGSTLSGGQRQRIGLSRLYLCKPNLIVMDEPTSAQDMNTEHRIIHQIKPWLQDRTALIITHSIELASKLADRIVVMERGQIVEDGTHEQLLQQNGRYSHMFSVSRTNSMLSGLGAEHGD